MLWHHNTFCVKQKLEIIWSTIRACGKFGQGIIRNAEVYVKLALITPLEVVSFVHLFIHLFPFIHSFIHFYWPININYNIIFSLPTNSKNYTEQVQTLTTRDCNGPQTNMPKNVGSVKNLISKNKLVAFIEKYTDKIILNLQVLWPLTVFTIL